MTATEHDGFPTAGVGRPILVVAHPDDEALWFTSVLARIHRIVVCFRAHADYPALDDARRRALADHPLADRIVDLGLEESRSFGGADWSNPQETEQGLDLGDFGAAAAYADRAAAIERALPELLREATAVFTHNPWGEYGHEDHVQVSRVVTRVATAMDLPVWYSTYASLHSLPLLRRYLRRGDQAYTLLPADAALGEEIAAVYRQHGAWTWFDDYRWFGHDCFVRGPLEADRDREADWLGPVNLVEPRKPPRPRRRPAPPDLTTRMRRRLNRLVGRDGTPS